MNDLTGLVQCLLGLHRQDVPAEKQQLFERFLADESNRAPLEGILQMREQLMAKWKLEERVVDIMGQPFRIPNATVGKPYSAKIDLGQLNWTDIKSHSFSGLEELGLQYDESRGEISGTPVKSGDHSLLFRFRLEGQPEEKPLQEKPLTLIINPDPKSLWKNLESDRSDPHWKEDNVTELAPLGDRHILVSSKRGRSHANVGSFREDDYAFASLEHGWHLVVVSDGAGSAKVSRKGSAIACQGIVSYFRDPERAESLRSFDDRVQEYRKGENGEAEKELNRFVYNLLGKGAFSVHKELDVFAKGAGITLKDLSATLVFCLWKKYAFGYAFLSFGVGDCPVAVLNRDVSEVVLMNWLDVGEFSGGTRFITMPEIFQNEKFATRFGFKVMEDFSYLILMSDGIFDPKFSVEAALEDLGKWQELLADLGGANEEGIKVDLNPENGAIKEQFSKWMDFWSPGNHDDRTLALVF